MENNQNNISIRSNISDISEDQKNTQTKVIPNITPIARKSKSIAEYKKNKRTDNKMKKIEQPQQQANEKIKEKKISLKIQNKKTARTLNKNNSNNHSKGSRMGSSKSSKSSNINNSSNSSKSSKINNSSNSTKSKLNSLNSSFSSVENFRIPKNNLTNKISAFTNNLSNNINKSSININNINNNNYNYNNNNNVNSKRSNLRNASPSESSSVNNLFQPNKAAVLAFNNNIKKTNIIEKGNTRKLTQKVANKLTKEMSYIAQKLKNESKEIKENSDLTKRYLNAFLFLSIYNLEVDACQKQINHMMIDFTEISDKVLSAQAECEAEIESLKIMKSEKKQEVEELEEQLRKLETQKALAFQEDKEILEKVNFKINFDCMNKKIN